MSLEKHFKKLQNMYHKAPVNRFYSPVLTMGKDRAEITMPVKEDFFHAAGAIHGSVYFKMLDDAAFFAANSSIEDVFVLTLSFNTYIVRPVNKGMLRAVGSVVHRARSIIVAEAVMYQQDGKEVARGSGTFVKSKIALSGRIGYD